MNHKNYLAYLRSSAKKPLLRKTVSGNINDKPFKMAEENNKKGNNYQNN